MLEVSQLKSGSATIASSLYCTRGLASAIGQENTNSDRVKGRSISSCKQKWRWMKISWIPSCFLVPSSSSFSFWETPVSCHEFSIFVYGSSVYAIKETWLRQCQTYSVCCVYRQGWVRWYAKRNLQSSTALKGLLKSEDITVMLNKRYALWYGRNSSGLRIRESRT